MVSALPVEDHLDEAAFDVHDDLVRAARRIRLRIAASPQCRLDATRLDRDPRQSRRGLFPAACWTVRSRRLFASALVASSRGDRGGGRQGQSHAPVEIRHDAPRNHASDKRLECGSRYDQTASKGDSKEGEVIEAERIEDGGDRAVPIGRQHGFRFFERRPLPRPFDGDNGPCVIAHLGQEREALLDVRVEPSEYDERPLRARRHEMSCGKCCALERNPSADDARQCALC
jgi:hypothetical protein